MPKRKASYFSRVAGSMVGMSLGFGGACIFVRTSSGRVSGILGLLVVVGVDGRGSRTGRDRLGCQPLRDRPSLPLPTA